MGDFLKGRRLWRLVTGEISKPMQEKEESSSKYGDRLEDWDSKNYQVITRFRNTTITSIHLQFGRFLDKSTAAPAQAVW